MSVNSTMIVVVMAILFAFLSYRRFVKLSFDNLKIISLGYVLGEKELARTVYIPPGTKSFLSILE